MENSMTAKLRPEQRKLWRRVYLTVIENGANAKEAAYEADAAVLQWEERGAFEVEPPPLPESLAWSTIAERLRSECPDAFAAIYDALTAEEQNRRAAVALSPA
jgi:hypothetical protein